MCLLLGVSVDPHEEDGASGPLVDQVDEGEVSDEVAGLGRPRGAEPEDGGGCSRHGTCGQARRVSSI